MIFSSSSHTYRIDDSQCGCRRSPALLIFNSSIVRPLVYALVQHLHLGAHSIHRCACERAPSVLTRAPANRRLPLFPERRGRAGNVCIENIFGIEANHIGAQTRKKMKTSSSAGDVIRVSSSAGDVCLFRLFGFSPLLPLS